MKKTIGLLIILLCTSLSALAQTEAQNNKLPDDLMSFFAGNWTGDGEFANGKKYPPI